jgi:hypothetical protein
MTSFNIRKQYLAEVPSSRFEFIIIYLSHTRGRYTELEMKISVVENTFP